jgi:hypothetical protein
MGIAGDVSIISAIRRPRLLFRDSVYFSSFSLAFPQEGKAVKRNEHREKWGFAGEVATIFVINF